MVWFSRDYGEVNQSTLKTVNIHQSKIDVVKFDGTNNFSMWRCEVMDALIASNLEDPLLYDKKPENIWEKIWGKMNRTVCNVIRCCLTRDLKSCDDRNFRKKDLKNPREQVFDEENREPLVSQEQALPLPIEKHTKLVETWLMWMKSRTRTRR